MCIVNFVYIHSSGHFGCISPLAIVNNVAVNINVLYDLAFSSFGYIPRNGITGFCDISNFNYWVISLLFSLATTSFYIPKNNVQRIRFLHPVSQPASHQHLLIIVCFDSSYPSGCEMIFPGFYLHFPND